MKRGRSTNPPSYRLHKATGPGNVSRMLSKCLQELGGQEFITEWARGNPTAFMQLYVTVNLPNMANRAEPAVQAADDGSAVPMSPTIEDAPPIAALDRQKADEYLSISTRLLDDLLSAGTIP